jgi:thiamine biosynthesis lipoprotein
MAGPRPGAEARRRGIARLPCDAAPGRELTALFLVACLSACAVFEPGPAVARFQTMGTQASLTLAGRDSHHLAAAERKFKEAMARLDAELSVYKPDSAISRLNSQAGNQSVEAPADTVRLLGLSKHYGELTDGAFDVTVGPVLQLWGFGRRRSLTVPSEDSLKRQLALVDYRQIRLDGRSVFLPRTGMSVDLGGIGKGYAVDAAWEECRRLGVEDFMIDLGGNVRVSGEASRGSEWSIALRNPFDKSRTVAKLDLTHGWAVASSGQYERFLEIEGRRYGHIIDPRTGYPALGLAGVTVAASEAVAADALSTSLFVMGPRASVAVLKKTKAQAVFIPDREPVELWVTPGIEEKLTTPEEVRVRRVPGW